MIELPGHLIWRPACDVNAGGFHNEVCAKNRGCLRPKDAPLFPPGLVIDQKDPEVALCLDLQKRSLVGSSRNPNGDAECEFAPGYPRPSEYWSKPRQRLQHWGTGPNGVAFPGLDYWVAPQEMKARQALELSPSSNGCAPELLADHVMPIIRLQQPGPAMYTFGLSAPAQTDQVPRRRNPLGRIVEQTYGVAACRETEILAPKPIRPSANPQATSQMSAFLARFTPETAFMDPIWARACLLHVDSEFFPRSPGVSGGDEPSDGECDDEQCSPGWQNWVEKLVTEDEV